MKKLTYAMFMNGDIEIKKEDEQKVLDCFNSEIELNYDEFGRVFDEAGTYIADLEI